jgi:hypothetical protein
VREGGRGVAGGVGVEDCTYAAGGWGGQLLLGSQHTYASYAHCHHIGYV